MPKKKKLEENEDEEFDYSTVTLDGNEATWRINAEGEINGKYIGTFKFRCFLTPSQRISANREYREMLGGNPTLVSVHESNLAYALTQLKYRVLSCPPFWEGESEDDMKGDVADDNIITLVLNAAIAAEVKYRNQLKEKKDSAIDRAKRAAENILKEQTEMDKKESEDVPESPLKPQ